MVSQKLNRLRNTRNPTPGQEAELRREEDLERQRQVRASNEGGGSAPQPSPPRNQQGSGVRLQSRPTGTPETENVDVTNFSRSEKLARSQRAGVEGVLRAGGEIPTGGSASLLRTQQEVQDKLVQEQVPELAQTLQEGRFGQEPSIVPIISPEDENLGVITDIALSLIPEEVFGIKTPLKTFIDTKAGEAITEALNSARTTPVNPVNREIQTNIVRDAVVSEVSRGLDEKLTTVEAEIFGIEPEPILQAAGGVVGGAAVGGAIGDPVTQFIGSDKTVRNLEQALANLDSISGEIEKSVGAGLSPSDAFDKLNRIEDTIADLEEALQLAAITSPNVRISLRGRAIETRILSSREKIKASRDVVAQNAAARVTGEVDLPRSFALLEDFKQGRL